MKRMLLTALLCTTVATFATPAFAVIGWAGNAFPNHGHVTTPTGDQFVVAQVYKAGVTEPAGQGPDISAILRYQTDAMGSPADVAMTYNTDIGNNDEYIGDIPQAALVGATYVDVTVIFTDESDGTEFEITQDQVGNPPPLRYTISDVTPNDIDVTFTMCLSGTPTNGDVCVIGSHAAIGAWGTGVVMTNVGGELYEVTVTFPAGSNPAFEYKYQSDGCTNWEFIGNRMATLPTDGSTTMAIGTDSFNDAPLGCGQGDTLDEDKVVCFQVCLEGIQNMGNVCVIGSSAELTTWTTGVVMTLIGPDLYQACVTFPAGQPVPATIEYKFKKDDCNTWESVPNRSFVLEDATPAEQTFTHCWDDGMCTCEPVPSDADSWGAVKSRY